MSTTTKASEAIQSRPSDCLAIKVGTGMTMAEFKAIMNRRFGKYSDSDVVVTVGPKGLKIEKSG